MNILQHSPKAHMRFMAKLLPAFLALGLNGCRIPNYTTSTPGLGVPTTYGNHAVASSNGDLVNWKEFLTDPDLIALVDEAFSNNQEYNILLQEMAVEQAEVLERQGEYLPFVNLEWGTGVEKTPRFTRMGALEHELELEPGVPFPEPLMDFSAAFKTEWEADIWKKLRNARSAASERYLASAEGRQFMATQLVAEVAEAYFELLAWDELLRIVDQNIALQANALEVVSLQKQAGKVTQLAVNRFEAQKLNSQTLRLELIQNIAVGENRINALVGRMPQPVNRNSAGILSLPINAPSTGVPTALIDQRPDIHAAIHRMEAAQLDVEVAKASFYPTLGIQARIGLQSVDPALWLTPESMLRSLAGDMLAPLVNRRALTAKLQASAAGQKAAVLEYEQTVLNAFTEVMNQLSRMDYSTQRFETKSQEVDLLMESVTISGDLFNSARADYVEVLLTQREALDAKMELVEIKLNQIVSQLGLYKALGGGTPM
jgi:multidrug efflux system outer membrane protein